MNRYYGNWGSAVDINKDFNDYNGKEVFIQEDEVVFAVYETPDYEGDAFVLFRRDNKLYEVHGSHCSCYGLEAQWEPEEVEIDALMRRLETASYGLLYQYKQQIIEALMLETGTQD